MVKFFVLHGITKLSQIRMRWNMELICTRDEGINEERAGETHPVLRRWIQTQQATIQVEREA